MNATGDHPDDLVRRIQSETSTWAPKRGARWGELLDLVQERPRQLFRVYALAGVALAVILIGAFVAMSALNVGSLASQPVISQQASGR